ncbi:MAG: tetratricopeptide repeat protein, partial [Bacteroidales bacterium]|nr:tetratricopeptide repeat protein [Bacteroidales bacterium]
DIYPYHQLALCYGLTGDKKAKAEALSFVMQANPETPMYAEGLYELGRAYMDINDNSRALTAFSLLRDNSSNKSVRAKALIGMGMVSRNTKDYKQALACYKEVVKLVPGSQYGEDALFAIESIYQTLQTPEKYLEYVEANNLTAGKSDTDKEDLYFNTAEQVYLAGNYTQAASSLQKYLDSYPNGSHVTNAYFYLAESYAALDNKEKACDYYDKVVAASDAGSFAETSMLRSGELNYSLERYAAAYDVYLRLRDNAKLDGNRIQALFGMMRSAFKGRSYEQASEAASAVSALPGLTQGQKREASYIKAKSLLSSSRRDEAMDEFRSLAAQPSTAEGAEANYILIQDQFDRADYDAVQKSVFNFSDKAGGQNYWLARCYITLADTFVQIGQTAQAKATLASIRDGYTPERQDDDIQDMVQSRLNKLN